MTSIERAILGRKRRVAATAVLLAFTIGALATPSLVTASPAAAQVVGCSGSSTQLSTGTYDGGDDPNANVCVPPGAKVTLAGAESWNSLTVDGFMQIGDENACGGGSYGVTLADGGTIEEGGELDLFSSSGCVEGGPTTLTITSGTLNNEGTLENASSESGSSSGGARTISGNVTNTGTFASDLGANLEGQGTFDNEGTVSVTGETAQLVISGSENFDNDTGGTIEADVVGGQADAVVMYGGTFTEGAGTISPTAFDGSTPNPDPVQLEGVTLDYSGTGSGPIQLGGVNGGSGNDNSQSDELEGNIAADQALTIDGGLGCPGGTTTVTSSGNLLNQGTLSIGGNDCGTGELQLPAGDTLTNQGTLNAGANSQSSGLSGNLLDEGTFTVTSSQFDFDGSNDTLVQTAGTASIAANASIDLAGSTGVYDLEGGTLEGDGSGYAYANIGGGSVDNSGGTLIASTAANAGTFNILSGSYDQGAGGTLVININGSTNYSTLSVNDAATLELGGTLSIVTASDFLPSVGADFQQVLTGYGSNSTGSFTSIANQFPAPGVGYYPQYNSGSMDLLVEAQNTASLTTALAGTGSGSIESTPGGINCGSTCSAYFSTAQSVTLAAVAAADSSFTGWRGDCSGTSTTCVLSMSSDMSATANFALTSGSQAISWTPPSSGAVGTNVTLSATGGASGKPVVFSIDSTSGSGVCSVSGTNGTTLTFSAVGSCVVDANQAAGSGYLAAPTVTKTIPVTSGSQAISWTPPSSGAVGTNVTLSATGGASGKPVVFSIDSTSGSGVCSVSGTNGTTLTFSAVGSCVVDANQAAGSGYLAAPTVTKTIPVTSGSQAISWTPPSSGAVGTNVTLSATGGASGKPVVFSIDSTSGSGVCSVSGTNGTTLTFSAVGSCVVDANQAAGSGYLAAPTVTKTIPVTSGSQAISWTPPSSGAVGTNVTLSATGGASGKPVVFSIDSTSGSGVCSVSGTNGTTLTFSAVGSCVVDANQAAGSGYLAAPTVTKTIPVTSGSQAISWTPPSSGAVGTNVTLSATGGASGKPVVFSIDSTSGSGVCSVSGTNGTTLTFSAVGSCVVDANQAAGSGYLAAPTVTKTIPVTSGSQAISWTPPSSGAVGTNVTLSATGGASGKPVVFSIDSTSGSGVCSVSGTNGTTLTFSAVGSCVVDANQAAGSGYLAAPTVTKTIPVVAAGPLRIVTTSLPDAIRGHAYSAVLTAAGGKAPYTWLIEDGALPSGLSLDSSTGMISGSVSTSTRGLGLGACTASCSFEVEVRDSESPARHVSARLTIDIVAPLSIVAAVEGEYHVNLSRNVAEEGISPYAVVGASGSVPPGLSLSTAGTLSGRPTAIGTFSFGVSATDSASPPEDAAGTVTVTIAKEGTSVSLTSSANPVDAPATVAYRAAVSTAGGDAPTGTVTLYDNGVAFCTVTASPGGATCDHSYSGAASVTITANYGGSSTLSSSSASLVEVVDAPLAITTTSLPTGDADSSYAVALSASGGSGGDTWSLSTALPSGLGLSPSGVISGTPTVSGSFAFRVVVTDSTGRTASAALSVYLYPPLSIATIGIGEGYVGRAYAFYLGASGGSGGYSWASDSPLPAGLSLSANGEIVGTPTTAGTTGVVLVVTDNSGHQAAKYFTITIANSSPPPCALCV